jgi:hypothetical protein
MTTACVKRFRNCNGFTAISQSRVVTRANTCPAFGRAKSAVTKTQASCYNSARFLCVPSCPEPALSEVEGWFKHLFFVTNSTEGLFSGNSI